MTEIKKPRLNPCVLRECYTPMVNFILESVGRAGDLRADNAVELLEKDYRENNPFNDECPAFGLQLIDYDEFPNIVIKVDNRRNLILVWYDLEDIDVYTVFEEGDNDLDYSMVYFGSGLGIDMFMTVVKTEEI